MPRIRHIQQRTTIGELDPKLKGRTDIDQYYGALEKALNVLPIAQGGFRRRPGLEYIDKQMPIVSRETSPTITTPNGGTGANANDDDTTTDLLTVTAVGVIDPYVVVHYDLGSLKRVIFVDVVDVSITTSTTNEFKVQGSVDDVNWFDIGTFPSISPTSLTKRVRADTDYRYLRFVRIGSTNLAAEVITLSEFNVWIDSGTLSESRHINFIFSATQTYEMLVTDTNIAVYKDGVYQTDIRIALYLSANLALLNWTYGGDTLFLFNGDIETHRILRNGSDTDWAVSVVPWVFIPLFDFVPTSSNPAGNITPSATTGNITITSGSSSFLSSHVNQVIIGNGGRARIVEFVSAASVKATMEIPFFDTGAIANVDWSLEEGFEEVWSATRGWPTSGTFYEGRFYISQKSRPSTVYASRVGLFFDFNSGSFLDDDAIHADAAVETGQYNEIINIYAGRNLLLFTLDGEYVVQQSSGVPVTPEKFDANKQTSVGSKRGQRIQEVEGAVYFIQKEGASVQEFAFNDLEGAYSNVVASRFNSHLVINPVDFALRKATSTDEGNYLILVNIDGSVAIANILRSESIGAFVPNSTDGLFKSCGVDQQDIYFSVERTINGTGVRYLERYNFNHTTDSSIRITAGLPAKVFTGLDYLEGETLKVRADDSILPDVVVSGGQVTIERDADTYVELGLDFTIDVKDLPVASPQVGVLTGLKKNVSEISLDLFETVNIVVNGKLVGFRRFGEAGAGSPLDLPPPVFSGIKRLQGFRGWDFSGQVTITQNQPQPMTVLSLTKRVNIA